MDRKTARQDCDQPQRRQVDNHEVSRMACLDLAEVVKEHFPGWSEESNARRVLARSVAFLVCLGVNWAHTSE